MLLMKVLTPTSTAVQEDLTLVNIVGGGVLCVGREREVVGELPVSVVTTHLSLTVLAWPHQWRVQVVPGYQRTQVGVVGEHLEEPGEQQG